MVHVPLSVLANEKDDTLIGNSFVLCELLHSQSWQSKGIISVGTLGRSQWLLVYKIIVSVRWQCLRKSNKLLSSWESRESVGIPCSHPLRTTASDAHSNFLLP